MPATGSKRTCWDERLYPAMQKFAERTHAEMFAAARRPVESISPEHVEWLRQQMELYKRYDNPKSRYELSNERG